MGIEVIRDNFMIQNFSKAAEVISFILTEHNKTVINEKFAADLDTALTEFNTRVIQTLENAINLNGTTITFTDIIEMIDNRKGIFEDQLKILSQLLQGNSNETYIP